MNGKTILAIDDDEDLLVLLHEYLEGEACHLLTTKDPTEFESILDGQKIDLIIIDLVMPGVSGVELINRVKSKVGGVPVIALSAKSNLEKGHVADYYLEKPFDNIALIKLMKFLLCP